MRKKDTPHYLNFTRKERSGILAILAAVLLFLLIPFLYPFIFKEKNTIAADYTKELDRLTILKTDSTKKFYKKKFDEDNYPNYYASEEKDFNNLSKVELFYFDPNKLTVDGWLRLGVKEKTANSIKKYLFKGGKFRQADDIKKIWGLRPDLVERLLPYVKIIEVNNTIQYENKSYPVYEKKTYDKKIIQPIDINEGDSLAYLALPGIGPAYARRIINLRDKLGGFHSVNQVAETFGLPDSTFQKVKALLLISNESVKRININLATPDEMKVHPYIRYQLANLIVQYRNQHGPYKNIEEIKKIMIVNEELFNKIAPYLKVQ